jgi:hypothetical protein
MTWIVKNTLKATLSFRGLELSVGAGESHDLDVHPGRAQAESSDQVVVAFEEGYLQNVHKGAAPRPVPAAAPAPASAFAAGVSQEQFQDGIDAFKQEILNEIRQHLPGQAGGSTQLEEVRAAISQDMQELVGELKLVRDRFATVKGRIQDDPSLSEAEVRARLAFLEEQERELIKNFESVGRQVEQEGGDVMDKADLLANL